MANLVTSPEILPLIEPVLSDSDIVSIKNTSKILEYRIESDNRSLDRERVETILTKNRLKYQKIVYFTGVFDHKIGLKSY